ncbi:MAG: DUF1828 domain-containing protein [Balneolaceae bacterium]|nr:MAG: DUF1828 domain-containing protein [Balneolaceae bacterium]
MNIDIKKLEENLCNVMCAEIKLRPKNEELVLVETPFYFADGDPYQIYIKEMPGGIIRLTDMGHTMMHLSYENNIDKFREGTRGKILEQIKSETFISENEGEFYVDTTIEALVLNIFRLSQGLTKVNDLTFLNRARAESTFYEDLKEQLLNIVGEDKIIEDYYYEDMENSTDYPIDYKIDGKYAPLFLFGIPNRDKARLTTIILERLLRAKADFDSLLIFSDQGTIPKQDLARLSNAGGEMIASLDAEADFSRKLTRRVSMN